MGPSFVKSVKILGELILVKNGKEYFPVLFTRIVLLSKWQEQNFTEKKLIESDYVNINIATAKEKQTNFASAKSSAIADRWGGFCWLLSLLHDCHYHILNVTTNC